MLDKEKQIIATHTALIHAVVHACLNRDLQSQLEQPLRGMADSGWAGLVKAIRLILSGRRDMGLLSGLDEEDSIIVRTILTGLQNPATLPDPQAPSGEAGMAAPGLAAMISQAAHGDSAALVVLGNMGEQMSRVGGDMARVASVLRPLINGDRDPEQLTRNMGPRSRGLVLSILEELGKLEQH